MMNDFWTAAETACGEDARDYFCHLPGPGSAIPPTPPGEIWRDLDGTPDAGGSESFLHPRIGRRVLMIAEAACHAPKLGRDLLVWHVDAVSLDPLEERVYRLGWLAGTAAHVLEAGARAAREQGSFSSSLMRCREVQESLAALVSGAELLRLGACRLCRLLEGGKRDPAVREADLLEARAVVLAADIRSVARSLLGPSWVEANLPAGDSPSADERIRR